MLGKRLISTCILAPTIISMILFSTIMQFSIFLLFICLIGAWEWGRMMRFSVCMHQFWICTIFGLLCITIKVITSQNYLCFIFRDIIKYISIIIILWWILIFLLILFYPNSSVFWKNSIILRFCFGILMILPFFWGILTLRQFYCVTNNSIVGMYWLLNIIILIWINDSSAYIIGRILGKYKLIRKISPQKTWEGLIGGILMSSGFAWLFSIYIPVIVIQPFIIFFCSLISIFSSVIGDFAASMFKREAGIKDTGNVIPGHGGIIDRIDSLIAAVPIFTCLILLIYTDDVVKIEIF